MCTVQAIFPLVILLVFILVKELFRMKERSKKNHLKVKMMKFSALPPQTQYSTQNMIIIYTSLSYAKLNVGSYWKELNSKIGFVRVSSLLKLY